MSKPWTISEKDKKWLAMDAGQDRPHSIYASDPEVTNDFLEEEHPRAPKGSTEGGRFVAKGHDVTPETKETILKHAESVPSDATMEEFIRHTKSLPIIQDMGQRVKEIAESSGVKNPAEWSMRMNQDKHGNWTPDREKIHQGYVDKFFNPKAEVPENQRPKFVFLLGPPGAGKGTFGYPVCKKLCPEHTYVNADDAKDALPEYRGWNAPLLHKESSYMAKELLLPKALASHHNIVLDATGKDDKEFAEMAKTVSDGGWDVHCVFVRTPPESALKFAWKRFISGTKKAIAGFTGRYVPLDFVKEANERSHIALGRGLFDEHVKSLTLVDNGEQGQKTTVLKDPYAFYKSHNLETA